MTKRLFGHICWDREIMRIKDVIPIWSAAGEWAANGRRWTNAALMLAQRRRRWASIKPALVQHLVFTWLVRSGINPYQAPHTAGTGRDSSIHAHPASGAIRAIYRSARDFDEFIRKAVLWTLRNADSMLLLRLQRWSNIHLSLDQHLVPARFMKVLIPAAIRRWVFLLECWLTVCNVGPAY